MPTKRKKRVVQKKRSPRRKKGCPGAKPITLTVNPKKNKTVANPSARVHVSKKKKQQVRWQGAKKFTIDFGSASNSPFKKWYFTGGPGNPACSGTVKDTAPIDKDFKYTAQVTGALPLDPIIRTDP